MKKGKYLIMKSGEIRMFPSTTSHKSKALGEPVLSAGHFHTDSRGNVKLSGKAESLGGIKPAKGDLQKVKSKLNE